MRIVVKNIEYQGNTIVVSCDSGIGRFMGIWNGRGLPTAGQVCDAELTVADIDSSHMRMLPRSGSAPAVDIRGNNVIFSGICEEYDGECHFIRMDGDWLQPVYFQENRQNIHAGDGILFWLDYHRVEVYPFDIV